MSIDKLLKIGAPLIAFVSLVFYFIGDVYNDYYLSSLGLAKDLFQYTMEGNIQEGYVNLVLRNGNLILGLVLYPLLTIAVLIPVIQMFGGSILEIYKWIYKKLNSLSAAAKGMLYVLKISTIAILIILTPTVFMLLITVEEINEAKKDALDFKSKMHYEDILFLKSNISIRGKLIICKNSYCAIYDGNKTITIPISNILKIEHYSTKENNETKNSRG